MALRISQGSGATLATDLIGGEHLQRISGLSLFPSSSFIGLVSIQGNVNIQAGATVNVSNFPATQPVTQSGTWTVQPGNTANSTPWLVTQTAGLISLASGTEVKSLATINNWPANFTPSSGATINVMNFPASQAVTNAGTFAVQNTAATPVGSNFIGLASIQGNVNIQSGATIHVLNTINALATITTSGAIPVTDNGSSLTVDGTITANLGAGANYIGLATVNIGSSNATLYAVVNTGASNSNVTLNPSPNFIGLVTTVPGAVQPVSDNNGSLTVDWISGATVSVAALPNITVGTALPAGTNNIGDVDVLSLPAIPTGTNFIGLASIQGNVNATQTGTWNVGISAGNNHIGSVSTFGNVTITSGTTVNIMNFPATQPVSFNQLVSLASGTFVSLNAGTNHVGSVTIFGNLTSTTGMTTLFPGPNFIGLVTTVPGVVTPVSDNSGSLTVDWLSGATVSVASLPNVTIGSALPTGTNYIGLVSISGNLNLNSGSTVNIMNFPATQPVTQSGTWDEVGINDSGNSITVDWSSGATVAISNMPTVTVAAHDVTNAGTFAVQAAQSGTWNVGVTGLISLASGTFVSLNAGTNNIGDVDVLTLPALAAGTNYIGLATVVVGNTVTVGSHAVTNAGTFAVQNNAATPAGANFIGLATVVQGNQPALIASSAYIGLASVNIGGTLPALTTGTSYIGLVTITPTYLSTYTSLATIMSGTGAATLFTPPSSQRWILKDLIIGSLGNSEVQIQSGANVVIPYIALATTGGYLSNFGDSGLRAKALNDAFVVNKNSAATISVTANVRFEA